MTNLMPQAEGIPLPVPSELTRHFWEGCANHELLYQRCPACGSALFDPSLMCRVCGSDHLGWERSEGAGSLYSWSTVWRPQAPAFSVPYVVAVVELDEGYHMITNLIGCRVEDVRIGMRVRVDFRDVGGGVHLPYFSPEDPGPAPSLRR